MGPYTKEQLKEMASAPLDRDKLMAALEDSDPKLLDALYDAIVDADRTELFEEPA